MQIHTKKVNDGPIALIQSDDTIIWDGQSALDFMMTVQYETGSYRIAINKEAVAEAFFSLSSGIAGEVLQRCVNYGFRWAVYGDFSMETSQALRAFILECNRGRHFFFVETEALAVEKLGSLPNGQ